MVKYIDKVSFLESLELKVMPMDAIPWQDAKAVIEDVAGQHQQTTRLSMSSFPY